MNINTVIIGGNLTREPEVRDVNGTSVCMMAVASNRFYHDRNGHKQSEATFVDVEVWGKQADNVVRYLHKGSEVVIEGRLKTDTWEDRDTGKKRSKMLVTAGFVHFGRREDRRDPKDLPPPPANVGPDEDLDTDNMAF